MMQGESKAHIYVVDDDDCVRDAACEILKSAHYDCTSFPDGESCLAHFEERKCDLLFTDVKMPGKSGIEVLKEALHLAPWLPIIVMTSYADVPMSVQALKAGAYDFIEKPFSRAELIGITRLALKQTWFDTSTLGKSLTKTERIVLRLLMQGMSNRRIAYVLQRSERTIEVHRGHIMQKLGVDNIVDLVKRASAMGFDQAS
ncbi:response regulator transcription factor [Planctomycetota bacterium]